METIELVAAVKIETRHIEQWISSIVAIMVARNVCTQEEILESVRKGSVDDAEDRKTDDTWCAIMAEMMKRSLISESEFLELTGIKDEV